MNDLDDILFVDNYSVKENKMAAKKTMKKKDVNTTEEKESKEIELKLGIGADIGTGYIVGSSFDQKNKVQFTPLRNAFFSIDKDMFHKTMFNKNSMKWVEMNNDVFVIGEDALTLAKIKNTHARRPLSSGIINNKERDAAPVLKEMFKYCIIPNKKKDNEICVFSVPGPKINDLDFDVDFHAMSLESLIRSFGLQPEPLNEGYAVILSEIGDAKDVTGLGISFGAGLVNVCFAYKSMKLFEFSIDKSGDFIDKKASDAVNVGESMISHIKENELDLDVTEDKMTPEQRALSFAYRYVIRNVWKEILRAFTNNNDIRVLEPIPVIVAGGTSLPSGFINMFEDEMIKLPFEITEIKTAKNRLGAVSQGCLIWANYMSANKE